MTPRGKLCLTIITTAVIGMSILMASRWLTCVAGGQDAVAKARVEIKATKVAATQPAEPLETVVTDEMALTWEDIFPGITKQMDEEADALRRLIFEGTPIQVEYHYVDKTGHCIVGVPYDYDRQWTEMQIYKSLLEYMSDTNLLFYRRPHSPPDQTVIDMIEIADRTVSTTQPAEAN